MADDLGLQTIKNPEDFDGLKNVRALIEAMPDSADHRQLLHRLEQAEDGNGWALNDLAYWMINGQKGFPKAEKEYATIYDLYRQAAVLGTPGAQKSAEFVRDNNIDFNAFSEVFAQKTQSVKEKPVSLQEQWKHQHESRFKDVDWNDYEKQKNERDVELSLQQTRDVEYYGAMARSEGVEGLRTPFLRSVLDVQNKTQDHSLLDLGSYYQKMVLQRYEMIALMETTDSVVETLQAKNHNFSGLFNKVRDGNLSYDDGNYREIFAGHTAKRTEVPEGFGAVFTTTLEWDPVALKMSFANDQRFAPFDEANLAGRDIQPGEVIELQFEIKGMEDKGVRSYRFVVPDQGEVGQIPATDLLEQINSKTLAGLECDIAQIVSEEGLYALDIAQHEVQGLMLQHENGDTMLAKVQNDLAPTLVSMKPDSFFNMS